MASIFLILSPLLLISTLLLFPDYAVGNDSNVLLTGDILTTDGQLSYGGNNFVIQDDCNLVLYNKRNGFQSNTHAGGVNCTLTLNGYGQLVIQSSDGSTVWLSTGPASSKPGKYAAVLRPDGQVAVYGPSVWSTPNPDSTNENDALENELVGNIPMVANVLFSSQIMYNNATLSTRDYTFVMGSDCNLALVKAGFGAKWESGSGGKGKNCFLRLDHRGELSVVDDHYKIVWESKSVGKYGDYVLILQIHGQAVVYGPIVWSTGSS